ncbi:unnamed protein product, partial [marine sediment metagenome]
VERNLKGLAPEDLDMAFHTMPKLLQRKEPTRMTPHRTSTRSNLAAAAHYWNQILNQTQRTEWNENAKTITVKNHFGKATKISGFNLFCRSYTKKRKK